MGASGDQRTRRLLCNSRRRVPMGCRRRLKGNKAKGSRTETSARCSIVLPCYLVRRGIYVRYPAHLGLNSEVATLPRPGRAGMTSDRSRRKRPVGILSSAATHGDQLPGCARSDRMRCARSARLAIGCQKQLQADRNFLCGKRICKVGDKSAARVQNIGYRSVRNCVVAVTGRVIYSLRKDTECLLDTINLLARAGQPGKARV